MKIILGTGNFNSKYHLKKIKFDLRKKKKLLHTAKKNKIKYIDTAPDYYDAEKIIGDYNFSYFKIISKIKRINSNKKQNKTLQILENFYSTLKNLKSSKIYALLVHDIQNFFKYQKFYLEAFKILKEKKLVKKIGVSLYNHSDLHKILKFWVPEIIQIPYNIIDRRIEDKKFESAVRYYKIKLHVRSIFFKGLLVDKKKFPKKLRKWKKKIDTWYAWCAKNNIQPFKASYDFVKKNKLVDKFVISFDDPSEMIKILELKKIEELNYPDIRSYDKKFINPYNW